MAVYIEKQAKDQTDLNRENQQPPKQAEERVKITEQPLNPTDPNPTYPNHPRCEGVPSFGA